MISSLSHGSVLFVSNSKLYIGRGRDFDLERWYNSCKAVGSVFGVYQVNTDD